MFLWRTEGVCYILLYGRLSSPGARGLHYNVLSDLCKFLDINGVREEVI